MGKTDGDRGKGERPMEMKTEYRRDLRHTWMILSGGGAPDEDVYSVRMLTENRIGGLLPCRAVSMNGELRFYYDISSRHTFQTLLETESVGRSKLEQLFSALAGVMERLSEYLLDPDGLILDPAYLYCSPDPGGFCFCWYPGKEIRFQEQARLLGSVLLPQLDQADRAGVVMGYRFYQYCESEELTLENLRSLLRQRAEERYRRPAAKEEIERLAILDSFFDDTDEEESVFGAFGRKIRSLFSGKRKKPGKDFPEEEPDAEKVSDETGKDRSSMFIQEPGAAYRMEAGTGQLCMGREAAGVPYAGSEIPGKLYSGTAVGTAVHGEVYPESTAQDRQPESGTMLLTPEMLAVKKEQIWSLMIRDGEGNEKRFFLTGSFLLVGKKEAGAALDLASPAVSRLHAKLHGRDGNWYVTDLNSRNGTRILSHSGENRREHLLQPEESVLLQDGDTVWFADVSCRVLRE